MGEKKKVVAVTCQAADALPLSRLTKFQGNLKTISKGNLEALKRRILKHGINAPFFIWRNDGKNYIIDGHQRVPALRALSREGYAVPPVPVAYIDADSVEDAKDKLLGIASQFGDVTQGGLAEFLAGLEAVDVRLMESEVDLDFSDRIGDLESDIDALPQLERGVELAKKWKVKLGQIWRCGDHFVMCGDSESDVCVSALFAGEVPGIMVTDPPYGVEYDPKWRKTAGALRSGKIKNDHRAMWVRAWQLFPGNVAYTWYASLYGPVTQMALEEAGFDVRAQIIWNKSRLILSRGAYHWKHEPCHYAVRAGAKANRTNVRTEVTVWNIVEPEDLEQSTVWDIEHDDHKGLGVSTQKPVECMARPIRNHTFVDVYDPFIGSGTTLIAAERLHRRCFAMDLAPEHVAITIQRYMDATGAKPELAERVKL